ncbi:hypothetical protein FAZ19_07055 [Sphingobacterium alkalisoli]|uniref:Uncharacterized protein n=1 Tax=Sphingobacterium alkalisoli TaxID=1874115 RepID=A0A4V5LYJ0_9SPHI|nr:hypothetical protein [Sphingobacterium alkalisoli]TJY66669.1 hypothetical protein FAZ19_07055 [Sphingobacterium alkalisoli]GGH14919.1 hypothetical protein GCM10011418_16230 [Sphingobacterium alkalisoli]
MIGHFLRVSGLLLLLASLSGCRQDGKHKVDEFYTEKGEWDSARIPFIKPYEAVIVGEKYGWCMNMEALDGGDSMLADIKEATVDNGFILVHTGKTLMLGVEVKESWWIIFPSNKLEKGFTDHPQYLAYLKKLGFKNEPKLHTMDIIANYYEDHDTMNWSALD